METRLLLSLAACASVSGAGVFTLDTPILTQTSTTGANPLTWSALYNSSIMYDGAGNGDKVRMRFRINGGSWTTETDKPLDSDLLLSGSYSWPLYGGTNFSAGGLIEVEEQKARFTSSVETQTSAWSAILSDTIAALPGSTNLHLIGRDVRFVQYNSYVRGLDAVVQETV